jgi:hypothetical protein
VIPSLTRCGVQSLWWGQPQRDAACGNSKATRLGLAALISGLLLLGTSCEPTSYYFTGLKIDTRLHLIPTGKIGLLGIEEPELGNYYFIFNGANITSVDHFDRKTGTNARQRPLYLETGRDQVLDRTVKDDEILSGPFGTVYAEKECFYTRPIQSGYSSVSVHFSDKEHEGPSEVANPTEGLPALTSLSLVRIFRTGPEYVVVSANYERDGSLGSLDIGRAENGYFTSEGTSENVAKFPVSDDSLPKYGIASHIDVQKFLLSRRLPLPAVALSQERNVMNEFYGFGKFIRQDELKDGAIVTSRWLQPSVTEEERETLNSLCDARLRQQQAAGIPTVR